MTHWLHKTDGDTEAQGGEGTHLVRHSQAVAEGASGTTGVRMEKVEEDLEVSGGCQEPTFQGHVTRPRPGLHDAAHLFASARPTRVCKRAPRHSAHTQPPLTSQRASETGSKQIGLGVLQAPPPTTVPCRH